MRTHQLQERPPLTPVQQIVLETIQRISDTELQGTPALGPTFGRLLRALPELDRLHVQKALYALLNRSDVQRHSREPISETQFEIVKKGGCK